MSITKTNKGQKRRIIERIVLINGKSEWYFRLFLVDFEKDL